MARAAHCRHSGCRGTFKVTVASPHAGVRVSVQVQSCWVLEGALQSRRNPGSTAVMNSSYKGCNSC